MQALPLLTFLLFFLISLPCAKCSDNKFSDSLGLKLKTEYLNQTALKHIVYFGQENLKNSNICLFANQIKLSIVYNGESPRENEPLEVTKYECSPANSNFVILYTNNPLNLSDTWTEQSFSLFPTSETLQTTFYTDQPCIQLEFLQNLTQQQFSELKLVGDTLIQYNLTDPSFSATYLKQSSMQQWYFIVPAYIIVTFLVVNYFIRSFYTDKGKYSDHGEIIFHYLALASPTFMVETLTAELMSFCYGFMLLSFPWASEKLGSIFGNPLDTAPFQMKIFFSDLGFGSTYALAFTIIIFLAISGYILICLQSKSNQVKQQKSSIFFNFLYNIFIYGALFSSILSIQGIVYNSSNGVLSFSNPASSIFYIIGILMLALIVIDAIHSLFMHQSKHFYKIRIIVKTMFLSLSHLRVNYFIVVMIFLDLLFAGAEYLINKKENLKSFNKLWVFKNILLNLSLLLLIFFSIKLLAVIISFVFVSISVGVEIYEHQKTYETNKLIETNQIYHPAYQNTVIHTHQTDRYSKRMNASIQHIDQPHSQLQIIPQSVTAIKSNRPPASSKRDSYRKNEQINLSPLQHTIEYEPRHRRERRKNSLKNVALVSIPNHKARINSSNERILHVRGYTEDLNDY